MVVDSSGILNTSFSVPFSFTVITGVPRLSNPLADQIAIEGKLFSFQIPIQTTLTCTGMVAAALPESGRNIMAMVST